MVHFRQIVIVSSEPENRHRVNPGSSRFFRQFDRRQRFIHGEHGSAEESNLLSGNHRERASPQPIKIADRFGRRSPGFVLPRKNLPHTGSAIRIVRNLGTFLFDPLSTLG